MKEIPNINEILTLPQDQLFINSRLVAELHVTNTKHQINIISVSLPNNQLFIYVSSIVITCFKGINI